MRDCGNAGIGAGKILILLIITFVILKSIQIIKTRALVSAQDDLTTSTKIVCLYFTMTNENVERFIDFKSTRK